ncbi:DMT family transporter [Catellatospora methionotrophica]|uniref:DMT family transporter n=1 Tax=Catellatospora methionotrophica TaxID=121620 RepID=UPI0033FDD40E
MSGTASLPASASGFTSPSGAAYCAAAMVVLGASVPFSAALADFPTASAQAARYALGGAALLAVLAVKRDTPVRVSLGDWLLLAAMAASGLAGFNIAMMSALRHTDAAVVAAIVGCVPVGLAVIVPFLARRMPDGQTLASAVVVVAGTALVHGSGTATAGGLCAASTALVCDVLFTVLAARLTPRLGALRVAAYSCVLAVPMLAVFAVLAGEVPRLRAPTLTETAVIAFLGLILTAASFIAWFAGIARIGADLAGVFVGLVPVTALAVTALGTASAPRPTAVAGVLTVGVGLAVAVLRPASAPHPHPTFARPGVVALPRPTLLSVAAA